MKEAMLYEKAGKGRVRCLLCAHHCIIKEGERGICAVRENRHGTLYSLVFGKAVTLNIDPIEKKPFFHFLPASFAYSVATVGCNFTCLNCQNHYISQYPREYEGRIIGIDISPLEIVAETKARGCKTIAYTYSEPTIFFEYAYETARLAHAEGLKNVFVSNGYLTATATELIAPYLDGICIDLKGISERFYRKIAGGNLGPVLNTIRRMHSLGVWVEIVTLIIPGVNDSAEELRSTAEAIKGISESIPWHVSRFCPAYRMADYLPTPVATIQRARQIGIEVGLRYVYEGNITGQGETTHCPNCNQLLIKRIGFFVKENHLHAGRCPVCNEEIKGVWLHP
ncbi:AmmeMemoRadiSam system radical SAM enzyme [Candidatus Acetothermia bacterium]|nr:AmmeMemoRadiSam system radical SAM enzyme [Candidatus Acetothermia bacterium]